MWWTWPALADPLASIRSASTPGKLIAYGLSLSQVEQQLANNNGNAGGSFIEAGLQQINISEVGLGSQRVRYPKNTVITKTGTPLHVSDIAVVSQGPKIPLGRFARSIRREDGKLIDNEDAVVPPASCCCARGAGRGRDAWAHSRQGEGTQRSHSAEGRQGCPFHRPCSDLVHFTTHTVLRNLTEGIVLVVVILFLFLGNVRGALIVALTIPFALLFAATCLSLKGIPANLLSLGALDFGMVVDGAVVMVENIIRHLSHRKEADNRSVRQKIFDAAHEVQRPVFYAIGIIITAYLPIFTLQRVEGRLFKPMAWTVAFALLGALLFSMLVASGSVRSSLFFPNGAMANGQQTRIMNWLTAGYRRAVRGAIRLRWITVAGRVAGLALTLYLSQSGIIGSEFLPHLDEGALWVRGTLAQSTGPTEGIHVSNQARIILCSFPEVIQCTSQTGRPDDGTDTTGFFNTEFFVDLKPKAEWRASFHENKEEVIVPSDES